MVRVSTVHRNGNEKVYNQVKMLLTKFQESKVQDPPFVLPIAI